MTPESNRARTRAPPTSGSDLVSNRQSPPPSAAFQDTLAAVVGEEDDAVKANVMSAIQPVMAGVICYLSEQKQQ